MHSLVTVLETMPNEYKLLRMEYFEANTSTTFPEILECKGPSSSWMNNKFKLPGIIGIVQLLKCRRNQKKSIGNYRTISAITEAHVWIFPTFFFFFFFLQHNGDPCFIFFGTLGC